MGQDGMGWDRMGWFVVVGCYCSSKRIIAIVMYTVSLYSVEMENSPVFDKLGAYKNHAAPELLVW